MVRSGQIAGASSRLLLKSRCRMLLSTEFLFALLKSFHSLLIESRLSGSCAGTVDMVRGVRESLHLERLLRFDGEAQPLESSKIVH
jgi:hypothetical protein